MGFVIALHVTVCVVLIIIILIQSGRGGGLVESFSSVESMFGTKTNAFLTRMTSILSILFFITCVSLAFLSARQSRSLMEGVKFKAQQGQTKDSKTTAPQASQGTIPPQTGTTSPDTAKPATAK